MSLTLSSLGKKFKKNLEGGKRIKNMELYTPLFIKKVILDILS